MPRISKLNETTSPTDADAMVILQDGETKKVTVATLKAVMGGGGEESKTYADEVTASDVATELDDEDIIGVIQGGYTKKVTIATLKAVIAGAPLTRYVEELVSAQVARIETDGGTVVDSAWMAQAIYAMLATGTYSSCKLFVDANFAVKKDGNNYVSKLYDISGNNNDAVQSTGANQPIWTAAQQNGRAGLVFDGSNDFLGIAHPALNYERTDPFHVVETLMINGTAGSDKIVFEKIHPTSPYPGWGCSLGAHKPKANLIYQVGDSYINKTGNNALIGTNLLSFSYSGNSLASGINFYINGALETSTSVSNDSLGTNSIANTTAVSIGSRQGSLASDATVLSLMYISASVSAVQRQSLESIINQYYAIY